MLIGKVVGSVVATRKDDRLEMVLYATGSSARQTTLTENKPCDAVIMAVVDSWDLGGDNVYEKWEN